jgi:hypothetical protein
MGAVGRIGEGDSRPWDGIIYQVRACQAHSGSAMRRALDCAYHKISIHSIIQSCDKESVRTEQLYCILHAL